MAKFRPVPVHLNAGEALISFLRATLGRKRDRIIGFATRSKTRPKFLNLLYHDLGSEFRERVVVQTLPESAWSQAAYGFCPSAEFGVPASYLRAACQEFMTSALLVTADGRYGVWREETFLDAEMLAAAG